MGLYDSTLPCVTKISIACSVLGPQEHIEMIADSRLEYVSGRTTHTTPLQVVVWRYPVLLPGDMQVLDAVDLPVDAEYVLSWNPFFWIVSV